MPRQRGPPEGRGMGSRSMSLRDMNDLSKIQEAVNSQKNAPWYIMHPESRFMTGWDLFTGVALIFTALITPYELAFLEPELNALFVVNRLIDLTFVIDMVFQFLTMHRLTDDEVSTWEHRLGPIGKKYLKGWFLVDVMSILPSAFDIIPFARGGDAKGGSDLKFLRIVRTARLVKMIRLVRSSRLITRWRTRISVSFVKLAVVSLTLELILGSHWLACILTLQTAFDAKIDTWYGTYGWCGFNEDGEAECEPATQMCTPPLLLLSQLTWLPRRCVMCRPLTCNMSRLLQILSASIGRLASSPALEERHTRGLTHQSHELRGTVAARCSPRAR